MRKRAAARNRESQPGSCVVLDVCAMTWDGGGRKEPSDMNPMTFSVAEGGQR